MTGRAVLSRRVVEQLSRVGLNDQQIADWYLANENQEVTRQGVASARQRWGLEASRPTLRSMPWRLRPGDDTHELTRAVRSYARRQAGRKLVPGDAKRLDRVVKWLSDMDAVLYYDQDLGWVTVRRRPGVDLGIIHEPGVR
jgi:hypothetical protein